MNYYYEAVLQAARYIEDNLTKDIKAQDIFQNTAFSQFHFMRVFKSISGHTIYNYIKRRKITEAAKLLLESDMRIIDISFYYGYNSQEAFTRAFKEVYNITPNSYRISGLPYKNLEQIILNENILNMKTAAIYPIEPEILYRDTFYISGIGYKGNNDNFEIPKLWNQFWNKGVCLQGKKTFYGLESYNSDFGKKGCFEYIAGFEADESSVSEGMMLKRVNGGKYAVFKISSIVENVPKNINEIYSIHLPNTALRAVENYDFEYYDSGFSANNEDSSFSFYIPVK